MSTAYVWRPAQSVREPFGPGHPFSRRIKVKLPYRSDNRARLKRWTGGGQPAYYDKAWWIALPHFPVIVREAAEEFGECEVWADYNERETCHAACRGASGPVELCECSCLGVHHGEVGGAPMTGWIELDRGGLVGWNAVRVHYVLKRGAPLRKRTHLALVPGS